MKKIEITFDEKGTHINVSEIGKDEIKSAAYALLHRCMKILTCQTEK